MQKLNTILLIVLAFTDLEGSPLNWIADQLGGLISTKERLLNKAPKIFAARVGFIFAAAVLVLSVILPTIGMIILLILLLFAALESISNICMGCIVNRHIVLKFYDS